MARRGRPRKAGERYADGKLRKSTVEQLNELAAARYRENMMQAANQPHRRGLEDPLDKRAECAVGRFCIRHKLRRELFDGAIAWRGLFRRWRAAKGIPDPEHSTTVGGGLGPSDAVVGAWWQRIERVEAELRRHGQGVYLAARHLCLDDADLPPEDAADGIVALRVVAVQMGRLPEKEHPFADPVDKSRAA